MTYPGTALSLENGHLRVSESAGDGGGKEDAFNEGNDSLKKKKNQRASDSRVDGTQRALSPLGFMQTLPQVKRSSKQLSHGSCARAPCKNWLVSATQSPLKC